MNKTEKNQDSPVANAQISVSSALLLIILFFIVAYIIQLGVMPLVSPDETRYAEIPREIIASGNWIVPHFNGIDYFQKPVLGYWLTATSELIFGYNNFAVRFPSALCTGFTALLIFFAARKFFPDVIIALLSSLIFLSSGMVFGIGIFAVLDAQTSFFLAGSLISFFLAYQSEKFFKRFAFLVLCGISAGLCFMIKGFLAFAILAVSVAPFLIWEKQWKRLLTMPWIPMLSALAICAPWSIKIWEKAPNFWPYFTIVEHCNRFFKASVISTDLHPQPFWFLIPAIVAGMLPWTLHLPSIFFGFKDRQIFRKPLIRYCVTWLIFSFIFFSASSGKLATYILPCFPPLAILTACSLYSYMEKEAKLFNVTVTILAWILSIGLICASCYVIISSFVNLPQLWNLYQLCVAVCVISFMIVMFKTSAKADKTHKKILLFIFALLPAFGFNSSLIPADAAKSKQQGSFVLKQEKYITPSTIIIAYPNMMHAVCWYLKRDDIYIYGGHGGELGYWIKQPEFQGRYINSKQELWKFIEKYKNNRDGVVFFMRGDFREDIPSSNIEDYQNGMMFSKFKTEK